MPEIVRKYLAGLHACGFAQAFEFVPDLPPRNAFTAACEKYLTGSDFLLFGVFQQLAAQLRGKQDGANFALERNSGASRPCRFDRDIAQFADADTSRAKRFHDEFKAFLFACACCREQAVIFGAGQLTAGVPEKLTLDFEEFLWAKGYKKEQIEELYQSMAEVRPFSSVILDVMFENFREYMVLGGMPAVVRSFVQKKNYSGTLSLQRQILLDYEEDITKYAGGLDHGKILNVYRKVPVFLGKENKKFQISKVERGARNREYIGVLDWLNNAGIVNICYCMEQLELPLKGNYNPDNYKVYFRDTGLLVGSLDEEAQEDLRNNKNFNTYKGAVYENIVGDMLVKQGYPLYFYKNDKGTLEIDFFVRDSNSLVPVEVKANDGATPSMNKIIDADKYPDVRYGIKLGYKNIGFNGKFYTFPYFLAFLLKRFLKERCG